MNKMFELYKDGQFFGERSRDEIENLAEKNKPFGYQLLLSDDLNIAILEKDAKKLELARQEIYKLRKITDRISKLNYPEYQKEEIRSYIIRLITRRNF